MVSGLFFSVKNNKRNWWNSYKKFPDWEKKSLLINFLAQSISSEKIKNSTDSKHIHKGIKLDSYLSKDWREKNVSSERQGFLKLFIQREKVSEFFHKRKKNSHAFQIYFSSISWKRELFFWGKIFIIKIVFSFSEKLKYFLLLLYFTISSSKKTLNPWQNNVRVKKQNLKSHFSQGKLFL